MISDRRAVTAGNSRNSGPLPTTAPPIAAAIDTSSAATAPHDAATAACPARSRVAGSFAAARARAGSRFARAASMLAWLTPARRGGRR